jgi:soluble lytic murein transglycosylase-like protein
MIRRALAATLISLSPLAVAAKLPAEPPPDPVLIERLAQALADDSGQSDRYDAEVWLLSTTPKVARFVPDPKEQRLIIDTVYQQARRNAIDADLVLALMEVESRFDRFAISSVGAQGLMQVMPFWRDRIGRPQDVLTDVRINIRYGTTILARYLELTHDDLIDALARYNGSRGRLHYPERVVYAYRGRWQTLSNDVLPELTDGCIAYGLAACGSLPRGR